MTRPADLDPQRIALVHEWLDTRAGSEQVFERMAANAPSADLYALTMNPHIRFRVDDRPVTTTFLQRHRILRDRRNLTLPLMPLAWGRVRAPEYDVVVTSSHAFSNYFSGAARIRLSYVHTPMRYAWMPQVDGRGGGKALAPVRKALRWADERSARRVTMFAGNSTETVDRIKRFYGRDARVIHPPVATSRFTPPASWESRGDFLLGFSRWTPYKRLDLVVRVGESLGMPVVIAGRGPGGAQLRAMAASASVPVDLIESPTDDELIDLYRRCRLVVFPPLEDFGIIPVEAQACGAPVAAFGAGGARDTVVDGVTGALSPTQQVADLVDAAQRALALGDVTAHAVKHAMSFSPEVFDTKFNQWVADAIGGAGQA